MNDQELLKEKMKHSFYVFLWMVLNFQTAIHVSAEYYNRCQRKNTTLNCYGIMPNDVPQYIDEVIVFETTFVERFNFTGKGWRDVKSLSLNPDLYAYQHKLEDEGYKVLEYFEFEGLDNLEKLQISCRCLSVIGYGAFTGLNKLKVLDLSNNENLLLDSVHNGFMYAGLTNLSEIYLANSSQSVQSDYSLRIQADFFRIVKNMPLKVFDISSTQAWVPLDNDDNSNYISEAFPLLEKLNLSDSSRFFLSVGTSASVANVDEASINNYKRLKILDISYLKVSFDITDALFASGHAGGIRVPLEISELYFKNLLKRPTRLPPVMANLTQLCFYLQPNKSNDTYCFIGNGGSLKKVVAAENFLIYIDPNIMNSFPNLQYLDASSNLLGEMISGGLIQSILEKLLQLETLLLSNNEIYTIPRYPALTSMKLRNLDLSYNSLELITFNMYNLSSLMTLDLRYNKITFLDALSLNRLFYFLYLNGCRCFDEEKEVKLFGNPFSCSCDDVHGLQWLVELNQGLTCKRQFEGHKIDERLVKQVEVQCKLHFVIAVFCVFAVMVIISFGVLVYYLKPEFKHFFLRKQIKEAGRKYREMQNKQNFPVFLSFCCEDDEIVMSDIYPNLESGLQKVLQTNLPCVATGYSAFRPGYALADEIIRCIEASSIVVFYVTNRFCRKSWCRNETLVAHYENKPIILMLWEEIDIQFMPRYLYNHYKNHARVHWVLDKYGKRTMRPGWDELCGVIISRSAENTNVL